MKTWRTLLKVERIDHEKVDVFIPACMKTFTIDKSIIPFEVEVTRWFFAKCNLDATNTDELHLSDFEKYKD